MIATKQNIINTKNLELTIQHTTHKLKQIKQA